MGAVNFSLDPRLLAALKSTLELRVFIETGTFRGDTIEQVRSSFEQVYSIELSDELYDAAARRFSGATHIRILQGKSQEKLGDLREAFEHHSTLFWLDAHWCVASGTAGELSQCPLLEELQSIGSLNADSVVLIDDARLFLAPPLAPHEITHWPSLHQIVRRLLSMSDQHEIMVINDVLAFFPIAAKQAMENYAQSSGTDWLEAANSLRETRPLMDDLVAKEAVLQGLVTTSKETEKQLASKKAELKYFHDLYNALPFVVRGLARLNLKIRLMARPRLGQLNQYAARPLSDARHASRQPSGYPKISIVTPSYSQGHFIERTLRSVLDQDYPNLEYFVQDGGSDDETVAILETFGARLSGWKSEKDSGQSQAINLGFGRTSGEIMAWLNSDDILMPGALDLVADYFSKHPEIDVLYGDRLLIDEADMEIGRWILPGHDGAVLSWADYIPQETLFWRRKIWEKTGGHIDESFRFAMDWDLLVRFRDAGAKFAHLPKFLGAFRIHEHQKTSATISEVGFREMERIRLRVLGFTPNRRQIRRALSYFLARHILVDIAYRVRARFRK